MSYDEYLPGALKDLEYSIGNRVPVQLCPSEAIALKVAIAERDALRAEVERLRDELSEWRAVAKHIYAEADDELRITVWAMAMLNVFASGAATPVEFDSTMTGGAYVAADREG